MLFQKEMPTAASKSKWIGLDHLRALAIFLVFLYHYRLFFHPQWIEKAGEFGWTGVDLFFVLSGFLIASQLFSSLQQGKGLRLKEFYTKRFFRIIPAYLFILVLYFSIPFFKEKPGLSAWWKYLTFTQNFGLDLRQTRAFTHAWSLCIEEQFYLLLPFILLFFIRFNLLRFARYLVAALFIAGFLIRLACWLHFIQPIQTNDDMYAVWYTWLYYPTFSRLDGLLTGVSLAALFQYRPAIKERITAWGNWLLLISGALIVAAYYLCKEPTSLYASVFGFPLVSLAYGVLVAAAVSPGCILTRFRSFGTEKVAMFSYSIYLSHKAVVHLTQEWLRPWIEREGTLMFLACAITSLLGGFLLHFIIEKPFLRLRDKVLSKNKAATYPISGQSAA